MTKDEKDQLTVKYHRHLAGNEIKGFVYFTKKDVDRIIDEVEKIKEQEGAYD